MHLGLFPEGDYMIGVGTGPQEGGWLDQTDFLNGLKGVRAGITTPLASIGVLLVWHCWFLMVY